MSSKPVCQLIGAGRAGRALAQAMHTAGYRFTWIGSLHGESAGKLAKKVGCDRFGVGLEGFGDVSGFLVIAVPDNVIGQVASEVAAAGIVGEGSIVAHLSGALGSDVLQPARSSGASVMAFHPAQTFCLDTRQYKTSSGSDPCAVFKGICVDMEGDADACRFGGQLAHDLGARAVELRPEQRIVTHLAMTVGSNFTVAVVRMAEEIMMSAGIDHDTVRAMLIPLFRQTSRNIVSAGTGLALTGPVARGDSVVVGKHLGILANMNGVHGAIYRDVARLILQMSIEQGTISESATDDIRRILSAHENR